MQRLLFIFFILAGIKGYSQTYNPANFNVSNKSYGMAQIGSTDARSQFYDGTNFIMRDYNGTAEVLTYLNQARYRSGHFPVYVHFGGSLSSGVWTGGTTEVYYFKNGTADSNLVRWTSANGLLSAGTNISLTGDGTFLSPYVINSLGSGSGNTNSNIGSGYRWAVPYTNNVKTIFDGFGVILDSTSNSNSLTATVDTSQVSTVAALRDSIKVLTDMVTPRRIKIQGYIADSIGSADAATTIKLNDGRLLTIFQILKIPNGDNTRGDFYYTLWNGQSYTNPEKLFPDGFTAYENYDGPSVFRMSNGNIGFIFHNFSTTADNPIQFTTTAQQAPPFTWSSPTAIVTPSVYVMMQYDVVLKGSDGNYYLPFAQNTNGQIDNQGGNYVGRYAKSSNGSTWVVASTILSGGADSLVSEPGFYEAPAYANRPYGVAQPQLTFYWRNRSGNLLVRDSLFGDSGFDYIKTLGLKVPNSTINMKSHAGTIYAVTNTYFEGASTQDLKRKQLTLWASSDGGQSFQLITYIDGNYDDSTAYHEGSMFFEDSTSNSNLYLFYTSILKVSNIGELYVKKYPSFYTTPPVSFLPTLGSLTLAAGRPFLTESYQKTLSIIKPIAGSQFGWFLGDGNTDPRFSEPLLTSRTTLSSQLGAQWNSFLGTDVGGNWFNANFIFNGLNSSGGTVTGAALATISNNGVQKFAFHNDGSLQLEKVDSTAAPTNLAITYWDEVSHKLKRALFPASGSTTLAGLTDVDLTSPSINDILQYDGTKWINATSSSSLSFGSGLYNNGGTVGIGFTSGGTSNGALTTDRYLNLNTHSFIFDGIAGGDVQMTNPLILGTLGGTPDASWLLAIQKTGASTFAGLYNTTINSYENTLFFRGLQSASYAPNSDRWIGKMDFNTIGRFGMKTNNTTWGGGTVRGLDFPVELPDGSGTEREVFRISGLNGTIKINTSTESTNIDSRKLYVNGSVGINKDSAELVTLGTIYLPLGIDTVTGKFVRLSGSGSGTTNLTYTPSPTNGLVNSSTGTSATLTLADATNAGLMSPDMFAWADSTRNGTNAGKIGGSIINTLTGLGRDSLHLDGDVVAPGNEYFYGTNSSGTKGFYLFNTIQTSASGTVSLTYGGDFFGNGTTATYTLPAVSATLRGRRYAIIVKNLGSGLITINSNSGGNDIFDGSASNTYSLEPGSAVTFINNGTYHSVIQ